MDLLTKNLANSENTLRYQDYDNQLNRMTQVGAQSDAGYNAAQDRALSAATGLGSLYNQTQQQQLAAAQALGSQSNADNQTALAAANGSTDAVMQALGLTGGLATAQYSGVAPAVSALQAAASIPYTGVNNYADLVNGLTGKYGTQNSNSMTTTSGLPAFLDALGNAAQGVGSAASGLKNFKLSDVRAKRDIRKLGSLEDGLGVYAYRYRWDDEPRIGVMAQEVAIARPWALGPSQDGYMTVDYGAL
jgi:hypothetical protein